MSEMQVVVARRPVVDQEQTIVGFELVFNPHDPVLGRYPGAESGVVAVHELLRSHDLKLDDIVGDRTVLCDVDRYVLVGDGPLMLPPRRTVLQVRHYDVSDSFLEACRFRRLEGYRIALDGFTWSEDAEALLAVVDLVRIDVAATGRDATAEVVRRCDAAGVRTLALGCDTDDDVRWAIDTGFDLLLGRAVQARAVPADGTIAPSSLSQVQLGMELLGRDLDIDRVERILRADPGLVAQVLTLASSGRYRGLRRQVRTLREALVVVGTVRLQRWAAVTILGRHSRTDTDDLLTGLVRARMCELLAPEWGIQPPFAFTAGLLSTLDRVLGVPAEELLTTLVIDEDLASAAFRREDVLGAGIDRVAAYQELVDLGQRPGPEVVDLAPVGATAFGWAAGLVNAVARETQPALAARR